MVRPEVPESESDAKEDFIRLVEEQIRRSIKSGASISSLQEYIGVISADFG